MTIICKSDARHYAGFVVDVPVASLPALVREVGTDLGIARLATIAATDGQRTEGSVNRDKARRKVAIAHGKVARAPRDYHHKQALALVRENQVIHVEDLNVRSQPFAAVSDEAGSKPTAA